MHAILYHRCGHGAQQTAVDEAAARLRAQQRSDLVAVQQNARDDAAGARLVEQQKADRVAAEQKFRDDAARLIEQQNNEKLKKQNDKVDTEENVVSTRKGIGNVEKVLGGSEKAPHLYPHFPPMPPHTMAEDLFGEEDLAAVPTQVASNARREQGRPNCSRGGCKVLCLGQRIPRAPRVGIPRSTYVPDSRGWIRLHVSGCVPRSPFGGNAPPGVQNCRIPS